MQPKKASLGNRLGRCVVCECRIGLECVVWRQRLSEACLRACCTATLLAVGCKFIRMLGTMIYALGASFANAASSIGQRASHLERPHDTGHFPNYCNLMFIAKSHAHHYIVWRIQTARYKIARHKTGHRHPPHRQTGVGVAGWHSLFYGTTGTW